jgi:hypothetical protein
MLPDAADERAERLQNAGLTLAFLVMLWFVILRRPGTDPVEAGLWYGAALLVAGTLIGYGIGFEKGTAAYGPVRRHSPSGFFATSESATR